MIRKTEILPTWDLSDLYAGADDPQLASDMEAVRQRAAAFEQRYSGTIAVEGLGAAHLRAALDEYEALLRAEYRPQAYAMLLFSTDTRDPRRGALLQKTREFGSHVATHLVFFDLEIGRIPDATYEALIGQPELAPYRHYVEHQRRLAAHNLSQPEERILVETANARGQAFSRLFTEVHGRTQYTVEREGESQQLNQQQLLALLYSPDRRLREAASRSLTEGLKRNAHVCTFIYNTLLHEKDVLDRLRRYPTPEAGRHLDNELSPQTVDTVVDVCVANFPTVARYYRVKRRLLGLETLTHYDRYAPIGAEQSDIPFSQARELVLEAFGAFSPRLVEIAEPFFSRRWIDAEVVDGKRGGAFCAAVTPDLHPYVLLSYTSQPRDVMTLAHELGHGIHDVLARDNHLLDYHPSLPMAETASTFGEMLVFDQLQRTLPTAGERLALVCSKVEDTFATVFRQVAMYRFEQQAHRARRQEGELAAERLNELWQGTMQEMFVDSLQLGEDHGWWWLYIPHVISMPFYVYAYAFGELLVLSLYAQYQREGEAFVERYFRLLAAGGSRSPAELVAGMGLDIGDRAFWQAGCDLVGQRVELAEELAG
ncbi:MAG: M3 family oligoendopeptidase [Candidatus Latescibacterota bacterium]